MMAISASLTKALALFGLGKDVGDSRSFTRVFLNDAVQKGAVCLDGSAPVYYFRPGVGSGATKWFVHHEGGGWCSSLDDCVARSKTTLGSSKYEDGFTFQNQNYAYFSSDPTENPMLWNWNMVYLRYCDGASFAGFNATVTEHNGASLYFRGRLVLEAVMEDALAKGMSNATDAVIGGCSAGGLASYLHVDQWAEKLRQSSASPWPKVVGMPDSGFFLDWDGPPQYQGLMRWVYQQQNASGGVDADCIEHYKADGEDWKCIFAQYTAPFIQTPIFPLQSTYDSWQADNVLGNRSNDAMNLFGRTLKQLVEEDVMSAPKNGIFLDSCFHHCVSWGTQWGAVTEEGVSIRQAFEDWYNSGSSKLPNKGYFKQDKPYPCHDCCGGSSVEELVNVVL